ncbi:Lrp/AsnC family transcriptional regulator [Marinitenerispora sediminis]|uniref:Lrp/AsnC family transcriptional regulator n=1 Tax=Marinitenerispora sediminis TaxID=1931232 RepID=A0A368SYL3_9ACTN|nr:Lrp/AsnC family transcriptional regulator [Marinitenerispora sediminis]RCV49533.1 Lrp/AsnC family transcriptional regulator [Marinitenerispora sediminis]RCV52201.1 Lrp/AsnC family transcriptional regulator [Marinitenerispora sediminis]RCV55615.1 Lrp/AsnC family transcriptional regulator [Marinitenerispora sediminis]
MRGLDLDATDAAIVRELQKDGRLAFETLAGRVGLSRAATRLRVRRLLETDAIRVVGVAHPAARDIGALAHLSIDATGRAAPVAAAIAALPRVTTVSLVAGPFPLVAEVCAADPPALSRGIAEVRAIPGVRDVNAIFATEVVKDPYHGPPHPPGIELDKIDTQLLELLERDGRTSFADMAGAVGLSPGAVRGRVLRLMEAAVVRVTALVHPVALGLGRLGGFALRLERGGGEALTEIASWRRISHLTRGLGRADGVGIVTAESLPDLHSTFERLRAVSGVRITETWVHTDLVKERYEIPVGTR